MSTTLEPTFVEEIGNTTVPAGRSIKLACSVKDLGTYKVSDCKVCTQSKQIKKEGRMKVKKKKKEKHLQRENFNQYFTK